MNINRLVVLGLLTILALPFGAFAAWGIIGVERKLDSYPVVSRETIALIDEMGAALDDFSAACEAHQAGERDVMNGVESYRDGFPFASPDDLIESASDDMYAAVARRKAIAAYAEWSLVKSILIGGQVYTHSTWLCAPAYASYATQVNMGFTPTYDRTAS